MPIKPIKPILLLAFLLVACDKEDDCFTAADFET